MCLAVPGKILSVHKDTSGLFTMATVDFCGVRREVCIDTLPEVRPGDYVVVHAGVAISAMNQTEASAAIDDLKQMAHYRDNILDSDGAKDF